MVRKIRKEAPAPAPVTNAKKVYQEGKKRERRISIIGVPERR